MAKIGPQQPKAQAWPWGIQRDVRARLVDRTQFDRKAKKKGDPKNPALASAALLEFLGPAHSAEEIRLPMPPGPTGHDADLEGYSDRAPLASVAERLAESSQHELRRGLQSVNAPADRVNRLQALLNREASMLELVKSVGDDMAQIERLRRQETQSEGY
jgi:hypothetical protein